MARVACSPITWGSTLFETVLDEIADAGYAGTELHDPVVERFDRQRGLLRGLLEERHLAIAGAHFRGLFFEREEKKPELERLRRLLDFAGEVAGPTIVVFSTARHPARRDMVAGEPPLLPLTRDRFARLADALNQYCDLCADLGMRGAILNRVGSYIETPDEYEQVIDLTDPELVWLAPDLGHWAYAGGDPASLVRIYQERIIYPRLKDFDRQVFDAVREERLGFVSFLERGGFRELGQGSLDLETALAPLVRARYGGWVCVELERTERAPREAAQASREYLRERLHW
jgi:inosose dehydratase